MLGEFDKQDFDGNADKRGQCEILKEGNREINSPSSILRSVLLSLDNENGNKANDQEEKIGSEDKSSFEK